MAALRSLLEQFDLLTSRLHELPGDRQVQLSHHLAHCAYSDEPVPDNFQAYRGDVAVVQQIAEAAVGVERILHAAPIRRDRELTARLSDAAQATAELLSALDTTTAGTIAVDTDCPTLAIGADIDIDLIELATVTARIERLRYRSNRHWSVLSSGAGRNAARACDGSSGSFATSITARPGGVSPIAP